MKDKNAFYAECLYEQDNFPLYWLVEKVLSKVQLADQYVEQLKNLANTGVVVYALKQKSQLNSLIIRELSARKGIPRPVYSHNVNMIFWQPFSNALKVIKSFLSHLVFKRTILSPNKNNYLKNIVHGRQSAIIHLGGSEFIEDEYADAAIMQLLDAQKDLDLPIYIVPQLITYGRRREKEDENLVNILFGQSDHTSALQRIITFLRYANKAIVISAEAINLSEFMTENKNLYPGEMMQRLRGELLDRIDDEKATIVGPALKSRDELIGMVLNDRDLIRYMESMAAGGKTSYPRILKETRKYLHEIASNYNEMFIEIWDKVLTWLWNNIYDGVVVDQEGMVKIRNISKKMPFVIIPCHRSHIDYLLLAYVFYKHNMQLPFIAAGTNMSFFPMGYIFRRSGAFFMRRSFKGNPLYGEVFAKYLKVLLREGLPLEFFIEGGRSRTGKMIMPKYGLLSMIIQAYQEGACDDLALIPVYIGYDRVIEEKSYLKELGGAPKEKEKTTDLIKSSKVLRKRYGRVYVNIGEPLQMKSYLTSQEKKYEDMTLADRQSLYRKIGDEIVLEISKVSVVTPYALISAGLLSHDRRGMSNNDLMNVLNSFYDYLAYRQIRLAVTLANRRKAIRDALSLFDQSGLISRMGTEDEGEDEFEEIVYSLEDDKRMNLEYYKNNILHYFLPVSFVATSILSNNNDMIALTQIMEDYRFFKKLFFHEFIFDDKKDDLDEVNNILTYLHNRGMIVGEERNEQAWIEVKGKGRTHLTPFAGLISNYIESCWVVIRGCSYLCKEPLPEKDLIKKIQGLGAKMYRKGEIRRAEALSQSNFENALHFLQDSGILLVTEIREKSEKKPVNRYALTEVKSPMESLRRRLFKFL
ncbi:MAG: 1-acyl-sn-glycerol-3-phosphate acyltransferase [Deltaproteobacteria bacterium]|nr:1-acyl-sn-glycerol-3-phosphate acyltransferase [Deltaproteobacteria bacterium]